MSKLLVKWGILGMLAALLLSGCFRPAGESIEPTSSNSTAESIPTQALNTVPNTEPTATSGEAAVTLLSPGTAVPSATSQQSIPALTEITVIPFQSTATPTEASGNPTATLQIITPGSALELITPDTATPIPLASLPPEGVEATEPMLAATEEVLVSGADCTYTVEPGDNLYRIAVLNNTTVDAMKTANPDLVGDAPILQPGQVLRLPDCAVGGTPTEATSGGARRSHPVRRPTRFSPAIRSARLRPATASP